MLSKFWFIITIVMGITYQSYSQIDSYSELQKKYEFYKTNKKLDSTLYFAKQMNTWALKNEGDSSLRYAVSLRNLGNSFVSIQFLDSAEVCYNLSLRILEIQKKSESIEYVNCLNNLGKLNLEKGNYPNALSLLKKCLALQNKIKESDQESIATILKSIAITYNKLDDKKSSEHYFLLLLDNRRKFKGEEDIDYAIALYNLALIKEDLNDLESALELLKQALVIFKKKLGEDHPNYVYCLNSIGNLYKNMRQYKSASLFIKKSIEIQEKTKGEKNSTYIQFINNLALLHLDIGDYDSAIIYLNKAVSLISEIKVFDKLYYSNILNNLGIANDCVANYKTSEISFKQSLEIKRIVLGEFHSDYASGLNNLAGVYKTIGDYKSAELLYKQAMEIRKKSLGENSIYYAESLCNLGTLFIKKQDYKSAELYLKNSLAIMNKSKIGKYNKKSVLLISLGLLNYKSSEYKLALKYYKKALKIEKSVLVNDQPITAIILTSIGNVYLESLNYRAAERYFKKAFEINKKVYGENNPHFTSSLYKLGSLYSNMGNYKIAEKYFKKALNNKLIELKTNFFWLSTKQKEVYLYKQLNFHQQLNNFISKSTFVVPFVTELSYNSNLVTKSLLLETSRELEKTIELSSDITLKSQINEIKQFRTIVSKMKSEGSDKTDVLEFYNHQVDSLDKILVNKLGEYANAKRKFEITWSDVQANLTTSEAAIEFARYYDNADSIYKYMALVVRPEYEYPKLVKLGSESNIKSSSSQREFSDLYNYVWRGIDSLLTDVKTIYYSPVGELNNVSFSALISENKTNNQLNLSKSNWSYLMDHYELHQLTTTRYLADGTLKKNKEMPLSIKLIGGVNYTDLPILKDSIDKEESNEDFALQLNLQKELNEIQSKRGGKINYLKGSEIEVKDISKVLNAANWSISSSTGKNAGEYQFKEELNKTSPGVLHIATHGFVFPEKEIKENKEFLMQENTAYEISEDPMVRCGLMFSGANISWSGDSKKMIETTGDDGILTASEVANLDLSNTKLVVLSACETGLGKIESSEGTFGLKRGFKLAGVEQIIVSLWTVPDKETMELMTLFYSDLSKTKDPVVSFNKAQKEMRNRYPYEPEKWAGFVLVR